MTLPIRIFRIVINFKDSNIRIFSRDIVCNPVSFT